MSLHQVDIPEGAAGAWTVQRFTISEDDARLDQMRCAFTFSGGGVRRAVRPGTFTRLMRGRTVVMSDTHAERFDHLEPVRRATGSVLINGLGIGVVLRNVLAKEDVTDVTVIELSPDVISLVAPHYDDPRVTIIQSDAMTCKPPKGKRYQVVWHDIWDYICADNLPDMHKLHRRYGRIADWQGSWCRRECERGR
ncbi:MAG: hypothetical protein ACR2QF_08875 [Geminicoccaceae bacterium]